MDRHAAAIEQAPSAPAPEPRLGQEPGAEAEHTANVAAPSEAPAPGEPPPEPETVAVADAGPAALVSGEADAALEVEEEEELSEAALAAADEALNQTDEKEAIEIDAGTPPVTSIAGVTALVRQNKLDEAINAVRALRKKSPKSAQLPYLLADLYFERGWWSDGLAKYREAIKMSRAMRTRPSVQRNAIRAFADDRTYPRARALLVKDVGYAAAARLRKAAKTDPSKVIRKRAGAVLARL